jgi:hypothetical protein
MASEYQLVATLHGGRSKKSFKVFWHPTTQKVVVERPDFFGATRIDTRGLASSRNMAFNVAEAFLHDK